LPFVGLMFPRLNLEKLSGKVVEKKRATCSCGFLDELLDNELDCGSEPLDKEDEDEELICFWPFLAIRADEEDSLSLLSGEPPEAASIAVFNHGNRTRTRRILTFLIF
jgi:hypothetical protein